MAHTQVATGGLMEKIEARALANKKARANFYQPDVQYERLTPIMKQYLETVGEKIVVECARGMAEEAKRANILASMPKNAPGYSATERAFELERIREQKIIQKILYERDQKLAKATRFQRHIPSPTNPAAWTDNEDWVNAVMKQAKILGIDPKKEKEYELLPLAAESLEAPLPAGWKMKKGGSRAQLKNGLDAHLSMSIVTDANGTTKGGGSSSKRNHHSKSSHDGGGTEDSRSSTTSKAPLVSYVNKTTGAVLYEHPLNSYYRSITSSRRTASELVSTESNNKAAFDRCIEAEHAMRMIMDKMVNPEKYPRILEEEEEEEAQETRQGRENNYMKTLQFDDRVSTREYYNNEANDMTFTLPATRGVSRQSNSRINTATTTAVQQNQTRTQSLTYRQSLNMGGTRGDTSQALPRVSLKEAGIVEVKNHHESNSWRRQTNSNKSNHEKMVDFHGEDGGYETRLPPPSPLMSPSSPKEDEQGSFVKSFKWSENEEERRGAFKNHGVTRPSVIASQREARRRQAELTDPHTQKVAAPKGYSFEDDIYTSSRKVLPGFPQRKTETRQNVNSRASGSRLGVSSASYSSYSNSRSSFTVSNESIKREGEGGGFMTTQEYRPGTTAAGSSSQFRRSQPAPLRKSNSLPNSPTNEVPYASFRTNTAASRNMAEFQRTSTPLASFMNDF